jgi:hypothetical protein
VIDRERNRAVDESKEFLRAYQRRRTWATAAAAGPPDQAATAPTPTVGAGAAGSSSSGAGARPSGGVVGQRPSSGGGGSGPTSLLSGALASPQRGDRPPDPAFVSMSNPVVATELDPAIFKKRTAGAQYTYGVGERRYQRDAAYAEELMRQSWYQEDG